MGRAPCCDKESVKRGPWSPEEDEKLRSYAQLHGIGGNWIALPQRAGTRYRAAWSYRLIVAAESRSVSTEFAYNFSPSVLIQG
jgi:hypothetical protein